MAIPKNKLFLINFQLIPEKNNTTKPEAATTIAVPRSGCLPIKNVGIAITKIAISIVLKSGGSSFLATKLATISGTTSFINSDG